MKSLLTGLKAGKCLVEYTTLFRQIIFPAGMHSLLPNNERLAQESVNTMG